MNGISGMSQRMPSDTYSNGYGYETQNQQRQLIFSDFVNRSNAMRDEDTIPGSNPPSPRFVFPMSMSKMTEGY